jgi:hypothetical protein
MDAGMRMLFLACVLFMVSHVDAQYMHWTRMAEDTIYYAREYFPDRMRITPSGPAQIWDFRFLRAPYAISRRIQVNGDRTQGRTGQLMHGTRPVAMLQLQNQEAQIVQVVEENPVCRDIPLTFTLSPAYRPYFKGVLGEHHEYRGKMIAGFAWPKHVSCSWSPALLPDSCRITYTMHEDIVIDGEGTLYLPTEVSAVYRHQVQYRKAVQVEIKQGHIWRNVTYEVTGLKLSQHHQFYRFVSADSGLPLAEIELRDNQEVVRVEFKTHPMATRIFAEEPQRPEIFAFPNPSFDVVRFQLSDIANGRYKLTILNILGTPVRELEVVVDDPRETVSMDLGDLQRGTYLYRLQDQQGHTIKTKRVVLIQS